MKMPAAIAAVVILLLGASGPARAQQPARSNGEVVYLPVQPFIRHGEVDGRGQPTKTFLTISVSIRNTDMARPMKVTSALYHDAGGLKLKEYVPEVKIIPPLGVIEFSVQRPGEAVGFGTHFVISWRAPDPVSPPIIEALHASVPPARAVVFSTAGRPIARP